jgi:hypothetical protein
VPEDDPSVDMPTSPSFVAPAGACTRISWPAARMLSGAQGCAFGQVYARPPALTFAPGVSPAAASAWAE